MQALARCRSLLISRNSLNFSSTQFASLHSTPIFNEKRKKKWNSDFSGGQPPSKKCARYVIRQKRADTKKALWGLCSEYGESGFSKKTCRAIIWDADTGAKPKSSMNKSRSKSDSRAEDTGAKPKSSTNKSRSKSDSRAEDTGAKPKSSTNKSRSKSDSRAEKIHNHRMRRNFRKGFLSEDDDDHHEHVFRAAFGDRSYSWSWAGTSQRTRDHKKEWTTTNESDLKDEVFNVGSRSDRAVLGLPQNGPLKLKDVKTAFHSSALKWHPDKHQGSSQAAAEEKFKLCVNAYNSLSSALSGA